MIPVLKQRAFNIYPDLPDAAGTSGPVRKMYIKIGTRFNPADRRRSQRILLPIGVRISGELLSGRRLDEQTSTRVVNAHGARLQLREPVRTAQLLSIMNRTTGEETNCTVRTLAPFPAA